MSRQICNNCVLFLLFLFIVNFVFLFDGFSHPLTLHYAVTVIVILLLFARLFFYLFGFVR